MPTCTCSTHIEDLLDVELLDPISGETTTVEDLLDCHAITVDQSPGAVFEWTVWLGDEARAYFDMGADLPFDDAVAGYPGVDGVEWEDRETLAVIAPTLCRKAVFAAVVQALADPETGNRQD